jgi:hypothetical protein
MADILIRCPMFGMAVPTGFTTEMIILDTLDFPLTVNCPACRELDGTHGSRKIVK